MKLAESILTTLAYHDIFNYPMRAEEIHHYLIGAKASPQTIQRTLDLMTQRGNLGQRESYYFLKGKGLIVATRQLRQKYSKAKLKRARFFVRLIKLITTVKLIAISGALAMQNSHKNDDIDLVIVTTKGTLWTTRFLSNILLLPFKRDVRGQKISDRACLNVFIDQSQLKISPANLYLAHEICQMKPIWDRDGTYQKFINANSWVKEFLPNWTPNAQRQTHNAKRKKSSKALVFKRLALVVEPLEALAKWGQLWYMRPKITTERIGKYQLFFHPQNTEKWVMGEYQKRLKKIQRYT